MAQCPDCYGTGQVLSRDDDLVKCSMCEGTGSIPGEDNDEVELRCRLS